MSKPSKEQVEIALACLQTGSKELVDHAVKVIKAYLEFDEPKQDTKPWMPESTIPYTSFGYTCPKCNSWVFPNSLHQCFIIK